jgi:hypothetical protein
MHMAAFSTRTCLLPLSPPSPFPPLLTPPPPFKCDNKGSRPARHFRPPHPLPPPEDYGQILTTLPKVEDDLHFGDCEYGS